MNEWIRKKQRFVITLLLIVLFALSCTMSKQERIQSEADVLLFQNGMPQIQFKALGNQKIKSRSTGHLEYILRKEAVRLGANAVRIGSMGIATGMVFQVEETFVTYIYFEPTPTNISIVEKFYLEQKKNTNPQQ